MPTYAYKREDGAIFEIEQRITEDALEECPETGLDVERIIVHAPMLDFRGSGFYVNDYGDGGSPINVIRGPEPPKGYKKSSDD